MSHKKPIQTLKAQPTMEGAGVTVHRTIGTAQLRNLDPFLLLDHFSSDDPDEYIAGFPDHPHRGFCTFTYMLNGHMQHKDSMGNQGDLQSGAAQWMKAASGVIHSEMPQQTDGLLRGFQLWINLPARLKMSEPAYQEYSPKAFPLLTTDTQEVKVLIGEFEGSDSPVQDPHTNVRYWDVRLKPSATFTTSLPPAMNAFVYVFEGHGSMEQQALPQHCLAVLSQEGETIEITAGEEGVRFIVASGEPVNEPVVQYGPFVMNTSDEIHQAMKDYHSGQLVRTKAVFNSDS